MAAKFNLGLRRAGKALGGIVKRAKRTGAGFSKKPENTVLRRRYFEDHHIMKGPMKLEWPFTQTGTSVGELENKAGIKMGDILILESATTPQGRKESIGIYRGNGAISLTHSRLDDKSRLPKKMYIENREEINLTSIKGGFTIWAADMHLQTRENRKSK